MAMTEKQKELILALATKKISRADFDREYPVIVDEALGHITQLLNEARAIRSGEDVECALLLGFSLGFPADAVDILCTLLNDDWHERHEDIVLALQDLGDPRSEEALFETAQRRYEYLEYNDSTALAIKCIWALVSLGRPNLLEQLRVLSEHDMREEVHRVTVQSLERIK